VAGWGLAAIGNGEELGRLGDTDTLPVVTAPVTGGVTPRVAVELTDAPVLWESEPNSSAMRVTLHTIRPWYCGARREGLVLTSNQTGGSDNTAWTEHACTVHHENFTRRDMTTFIQHNTM